MFRDFRKRCAEKTNVYVVIWCAAVIAILALLGYLLSSTYRFQNVDTQQSSSPDWLLTQDAVSLDAIFANFGSAGAKAYGAAEGVLLDSALPGPRDCRSSPFGSWKELVRLANTPSDLWTRVRDSNLVFKTLVDRFVATKDQKLQHALNSYVLAQASMQQVKSPSGGLNDGTGLSEPRFLPNITADPDNYGRPKRDGPALRAIVLMTYGRWLLDNGHREETRNVIWPVVRNDLNYVIEFWHQPGIDFWSTGREPYVVDSFFMRAVHHQALVKGAAFAKTVGDDCPACESQAPQLLCTMQDFQKISEKDGFIAADLSNGTIRQRNGRDISTVLASIFSFDPEAGCNEETFQPCSQAMLRNHKELVDSFRGWTINDGISVSRAVAVGRYPDETDSRYQWKEEGMIFFTSSLEVSATDYD